jgi:hypothetical protein
MMGEMNMSRKLILHIGSEKTGTTSLQESFYTNRNLLMKNGFYIPEKIGLKNNKELVLLCLDEGKYDDYYLKNGIYNTFQRNKLNKSILQNIEDEFSSLDSNIHTVVISSEHFHSRVTTISEITRLKKLMEKYFSLIEVVCYIREQSSLSLSWYSTIIKSGNIKINGRSPDFDTFLDQWCRLENQYFNYYKMLVKWRKIFQQKDLKVRIYNRKYLHKGCVVCDFNKQFFGDIEGIVIPVYKNESLSVLGIELGKFINALFPKFTIYTRLRTFGFKFINRLPSRKKITLKYKQEKKIKDEFRESNDNLSKEFLNNITYWYK